MRIRRSQHATGANREIRGAVRSPSGPFRVVAVDAGADTLVSMSPLAACVWILAWMGPAPAPSRPTAPPPAPSDAGGGPAARPIRSADAPPPAPPAARTESTPPVDEPTAPPQDLSRTWNYARGAPPAEPRYVRRPSATSTSAGPHPIGFYSGVSSKTNTKPPLRSATHRRTAATVQVTWTGFERTRDGSQVFLQLSGDAPYEVTTSGTTITVRIRNAKANARNHLRPLDLRYFDTPVRTVRVKHQGADTVATLTLERPTEPVVEIVSGPEGYRLLVIRFAATGAP